MDNTSITFTLAVVGASVATTDINNFNTAMAALGLSTGTADTSMDGLVTSLGLASTPMTGAKTQADDFAKATGSSVDALVAMTNDAPGAATAIVASAVAIKNAWEGSTVKIGNDLTQALIKGWDSGKDTFIVFRDWLVSEFAKLVLSPVINFIVSPIAAAVNSGLSSITGGILGNAAGNAAGGGAGGAGAGGASGSGGLLSGAGTAVNQWLGGLSGAGSGVTIPGAVAAVSTPVATGTAVGTDLGLLGTAAPGSATGVTTGAAVAGDAAAAGSGLSGLAAAGVAGAIFAGGVALANWMADTEPVRIISTGSLPDLVGLYSGTTATSQSGDITAPYSSITYDEVQNLDGTGPIMYNILGDGMPFGTVSSLTDVAGQLAVQATAGAQPDWTGSGFASGGDFYGGIRLVGERGPELELTGPSRIFDAQTTASMLRSGGASGPEFAEEMRLLREAVDRLQASVERGNENTSSAARSLSGQQGVPFLVQVAPT